MRKFFYSISIFLFLCMLSAGYYHSYEFTKLRISPEESRAEKPEDENISVSQQENAGYGLFYLKEQNGYVAVFEADRTTLYEPTRIAVDSLPESMQEEIRAGKYLKTRKELYSFLENYSS